MLRAHWHLNLMTLIRTDLPCITWTENATQEKASAAASATVSRTFSYSSCDNKLKMSMALVQPMAAGYPDASATQRRTSLSMSLDKRSRGSIAFTSEFSACG